MVNGKQYFSFEIFSKFPELRHAVTSRHVDITDTKNIQKILGVDEPPIAFETQSHGTDAWIIEKNPTDDVRSIKRTGDVLITNLKNVPLMIRIADCASILLFDPKKKVIANIHAGWRGISKRIIHKTIDRLEARFGVERSGILAAISPMLGTCCSRFTDPFHELPKDMHRFITEENHVDLWAAVEGHMRECGVLESNIENPRVCTFCHPEFFYSHRREVNAARFATVVMLT